MASRVNKFAPLSPEFEEEEKQRLEKEAQRVKKEIKKEAKKEQEPAPKEEAAPKQPVEANKEYANREQSQRGQTFRGNRYRGARGSYRGRGVVYVQKGTEQQRDSKDFRFRGSNDPIHPYDRRSGTGRGHEIQKEGRGYNNWGREGDEYYYEEPLAEEKQEKVPAPTPVSAPAPASDVKKEEEAKVEGEKAAKGKRKRKKEDKKEEKEEEDLDKDGKALTYKQYQEKLAKETLIVKEKKPEEKVVLDPKKAEQVKAYVKPSYAPKPNKPQEEPAKIEKEIQPAGAIEGLKLLGKLMM
jgi:hypothetical protein